MGFGFGFGFGLGRWRAGGSAQAGPVVIAPGSLDGAAFRIGAALTVTAGSAVPSGGGTLAYERRWLVGSAEVAGAAYTPQPADDGLPIAAQWRAVETGGASDGATPWQTVGAGTVAYPAPGLTASGSLAGRTLTISVETLSDGASAALSALTLGGADVRAEAIGTGPWAYAVPSSASEAAVAWNVEATSSGGTATASGVQTVPADLFAPAAAGGIADQGLTLGAAIAPLDVAADFSGTAPIAFALAPASAALPAGLALSSAGLLTGTPAEAVSRTLVVRGTNPYGAADTGFAVTVAAPAAWDVTGGEGAIALAAAPAVSAPTATGGEGEITFTE